MAEADKAAEETAEARGSADAPALARSGDDGLALGRSGDNGLALARSGDNGLATPQTCGLAAQIQTLLDSRLATGTKLEVLADRVDQLVRHGVASGHVTLNQRQEGNLGRVRVHSRSKCDSKGKESEDGSENDDNILFSLVGLVAALRDEAGPLRLEESTRNDEEEGEQRHKDSALFEKVVEEMKEKLMQSDEGLKALRQRIHDQKKITPSAVRKILQPYKARLHAAYYLALLEEAQTNPPEAQKSRAGRERFFESIVHGLAMYAVVKGEASDQMEFNPEHYLVQSARHYLEEGKV